MSNAVLKINIKQDVQALALAVADACVMESRGGSWGITRELFAEAPDRAEQALRDERIARGWSAKKGAGKTLSNYALLCAKAHKAGMDTLPASVAALETKLKKVEPTAVGTPTPTATGAVTAPTVVTTTTANTTESTGAATTTAKKKTGSHDVGTTTEHQAPEKAVGSQADVLITGLIPHLKGASTTKLNELLQAIQLEMKGRDLAAQALVNIQKSNAKK